MCGIAGFVNASETASERGSAILSRMTGAIAHRGPDDSGLFEAGRVFLGHRRLSIIDLASGHQPMMNEDGTVHIVYNGEIFNHTIVRKELENAGHIYRTHCDTETILHGYEQFGAACLERFRGMFAFALWDRTGALYSARGTGWESNRFTTTGMDDSSRLLQRSRRCSSIPPFHRPSNRRCSRSISPSAIRAENTHFFPVSADSCRGII